MHQDRLKSGSDLECVKDVAINVPIFAIQYPFLFQIQFLFLIP